MQHYKGIKISYLTWLKGTGFILIYYVAEAFLLALTVSSQTGRRTECLVGVQLFLLVLYQLFMVAWIIVGGILLFKEVEPGCGKDTTQWQFGLALFIVQILCNGLHLVLKCSGLVIDNMN